MLIYAILSHLDNCNFLFTHLSEEGSGPTILLLECSPNLFSSQLVLCVSSRRAVYPLTNAPRLPWQTSNPLASVGKTLKNLYQLSPEPGSPCCLMCMLLRALQIRSGISDNCIYSMADVISEHYQ